MAKELFTQEFVDRAPQIEAFLESLSGASVRTVFLIQCMPEIEQQARQGNQEAHAVGKSFLLDQFLHVAAGRPKSRLDFQDGEEHNFLSIIWTVIEDLGEEAFPETLKKIRQVTGVRHDIRQRIEVVHLQEAPASGVKIEQSKVQVRGDLVGRDLYKNTYHLPPTENDLQRQAFEKEISTAFFEECRTFAAQHRPVLAFDSYEAASTAARSWMTGSLLDEIARERLQNLLVIIAGREFPEIPRRLIPMTALASLGPFGLVASARYWVRRRGLSLDGLASACERTHGHPKLLAEYASESGGSPLKFQIEMI